MSRKSKIDKTLSLRPTFTVFRTRCPICLILNKKSKYKTVEIGYFSSKKEKNIIINNE